MKENKECNIKVRLTQKEKERLVQYCAAYGVSMSSVIREALENIIKSKGEN